MDKINNNSKRNTTKDRVSQVNKKSSNITICTICNRESVMNGKHCQPCIRKEEARCIRVETEYLMRDHNISVEKAEQIAVAKRALYKTSLELITSQFDDTTIIQYFLTRFDTYKSYDGVLYHFNGSHWIKGDDQYIVRNIDTIAKDLERVIIFEFQGDDLIRYAKRIKPLRSVKYKKILIEGITGYVKVNTDLWDLNPDLIGFNNGVYDLLNNSFREGRKEDYITMVIDYDYTQSCAQGLADVHDYFKQIMPIQEERELLCLLLSTMLSGRHLERFIICTGEGRNGKDTTFTHLMSKVLGPYYYNCSPTAITQTIRGDQNVSVANFDKRRAVVMSEPDDRETIKTAMVKTLTGANQTAMRTLYSTKTKVNLCESLFMLCNEKPLLDRSQQAMLDRLIIMPFRSTFKPLEWMNEHGLSEGENHVYQANEIVKSDEYADYMKIHLFNYLLPYYAKFRKDGYLIRHTPESIKELNRSYMEKSDQFMTWFNSEYERTTNKEDTIKIDEVFTKYCESEFYFNLTKQQKRDNNKTRFREMIASNLSLRVFYKEKYQPLVDGKQVWLRNVLTNHRARSDESDNE